MKYVRAGKRMSSCAASRGHTVPSGADTGQSAVSVLRRLSDVCHEFVTRRFLVVSVSLTVALPVTVRSPFTWPSVSSRVNAERPPQDVRPRDMF